MLGRSRDPGYHDRNQRAFLATPFYRQVDITPDVPSTFGSGSDNTRDTGCVLVSTANMCRSLIALKAKTRVIPIMTPLQMNDLLIAGGAYDENNQLKLDHLPSTIGSFANVQAFLDVPINSTNYDEVLTEQVYTMGRRVVLKFMNAVTDQTTGLTQTGPHYVWVIGKEGSDWKLADPGWNNVATGQSLSVLSSLQSHLAGFTTTSARTGHTISHQFALDSLHAFQNLDYVLPTNPAQAKIPGRARTNSSTTGSVSAVSIDAIGPVTLILTDTARWAQDGFDQQSGTNISEIPDASYFVETPILSPDGDVLGEGDPVGNKTTLRAVSDLRHLYRPSDGDCRWEFNDESPNCRPRRSGKNYDCIRRNGRRSYI